MVNAKDAEMGSKQLVAAADPAIDEKLAAKIEHHEEIVDDAAVAASKDHDMGVMAALKVSSRRHSGNRSGRRR